MKDLLLAGVFLWIVVLLPCPVLASSDTRTGERGLGSELLEQLLGDSSGSGSLAGTLGSLLGDSGGNSSSSTGTLGSLWELFEALQTGTRSMKDCTVKAIPDQTYTGRPITPTVTVTWKGTRLKKNTDVKVSYSDNVKVGTAKIKLTGKGQYKGTKTVTFRIVRKNSSGKKGNNGSGNKDRNGTFRVKLSKTSYVYNGKPRKPAVKVTFAGKTVPASARTVTYKNNKNVGKALVTVKGKGDYKGISGEAEFRITLKPTTLKTASSPEPGCLKAGWTSDTQADGYQVQACTSKAFSSGVKKQTVTGGTKKTCVFEKLASGKTWYVRIRSFKKVGSGSWYCPWSAPRKVKIK